MLDGNCQFLSQMLLLCFPFGGGHTPSGFTLEDPIPALYRSVVPTLPTSTHRDIAVVSKESQDFISLTDMVKGFDGGNALIEQWLKNKDTVLFLAVGADPQPRF